MRQPTRIMWTFALTASLVAAAAHVATAQDTAAPSVSPSRVASDAVLVTVRARADDPCSGGPDCRASVSISPAGSTVPVLQGTLDPVTGTSEPGPGLVGSLGLGTYAVSVTALGLHGESELMDPPGQAPSPIGGCGAKLELVPGQPMVTVTAHMQWSQAACGVVIEPRAAVPQPGLAERVRATGQPPRYRPRGAPDATATANGIRLDLWVKDATLEQRQWLLAHLRVTNVGRKAVTYDGIFDGLRCPPLRFTADTSALFDPGQTWTGVAGAFKGRFMDQGLLQRTPLTIPKRDRGRGCGDVGRVSRLAPGAVVEVPLAGVPAYELRGQPLPPGVIHVSAAFRGREFGDPDRVSVGANVTLAGDPVRYPSPGRLVDVALSTPGFVEALELAPDTDAWMNAWTSWWRKRPYPPQPRMAGAADAPNGILEIGQFVGSDMDRPFVVSAVIDPWTGEAYGSSWF